jgi:site-specific DNA-cytosine methylase
MLHDLTAIDCQGFAGGFTLGTVQSGFRLVGKREMRGGFGVFNCEANRHLLGEHWEAQVADPAEWVPYKVDFVFGNPPCSGFSTLSPKAFRGMDSKINDCMWAFAHFAASCYPQVAIFESVQAAFKKGQSLMQALRERVEALTHRRWNLYHVLHNAVSVGGCAQRKRYFWVISQVPFGIEPPGLTRIPSLQSAIGDLLPLEFTFDPQPYRAQPSWWAQPRISPDGLVDGHQYHDGSYYRKSLELITDQTGPWEEGQRLQQRMQMYYEKYGDLPDSWETRKKNLIRSDFWCGASQLTRWRWKEPARVITGAGLESVLHPVVDRPLTHREVARIMGFPDTWYCRTFEDAKSVIRQTWGKGIPVDCGRWISGWARQAILGNPGSDQGEPVGGDHEFLIDVTHSYKLAEVA